MCEFRTKEQDEKERNARITTVVSQILKEKTRIKKLQQINTYYSRETFQMTWVMGNLFS